MTLARAQAQAMTLRAMLPSDVDTLLAIEQRAYAFPWTRGNFIDSLAAGYVAQMLVDGQQQPLGYYLAMQGFEEMHLLNITVDPRCQGQGLAVQMLDALSRHARAVGACQIWLEVRQSNERARRIYARYGFIEQGLRRSYYPAGPGRREDAIVMSLQLTPLEARP